MKRLAFLFALLLCSASLAFSIDFGLILSQEIELENDHFIYTPAFTPWFSWEGDKNLSVYISNRFFFEYHNYSDNEARSGWAVPVFRSELAYSAVKYRINESMSLEGGRIDYADAIGFAADGLFDGIRFQMDFSKGALNASVFYTGLLYKETALILMTENDIDNYFEPWVDDFDYFFASRRFLASVRWDMPLAEKYSLSAEFLAQSDLNDTKKTLNSQYLEVAVVFNPLNSMEVSGGVIFEAMQSGGGNSSVAFGALAGMKMEMPGSLNDLLKASVKFTTGPQNDESTAFTPINCTSQGEIFPGILSGLLFPSLDYSVRLHNTLFASGSFRYYIRTYNDALQDGTCYGSELWASVVWQPFDDIRLMVGGGVFLPSFGDVYPKDTDPMGRLNVIFTLSL